MAILTALDDAEVATICAAFGVQVGTASGVLAGSVNTNYRVDARDGRVWFLRVYEEQGPEGAARDVALIARLASLGVPTPAPVPRTDGPGAVLVHRGKACALFPFVVGAHRCQRSVSSADTRVVGAALARVHAVGSTLGPDAGLTRPSRFDPDALRRRLSTAALETHELRSARARVDAILDDVGARQAHAPALPLIHGDLFRDNVLFTDTGAVLLDFESASTGAAAFDVAVTLLAWCYGDDLDVELARAMISGYAEERPLSSDDSHDLFDAATLACARFATTRITDYELRPRGVGVYKDFRRWLARLDAVVALGPEGLGRALGLP